MVYYKDPQGQENYVVKTGLTKLPQPHLTGMVLAGDIRINGLTLNTVDANNVVWVCTDIEGWWNASGVEVQDYKRGLDDGSYDVRGRWTARSLTLTGSILTQSPSQVPAARQTLLQAFNLVYTGAWLFVDESPKKAAYVRLAGQPTVTNTSARGRIDFSIPLKAGDPIKYNWSGFDGATTAATGDGTTATITTASAHGFSIGDVVTVAGVSPTGYNGTYTLTAVTSGASNTISYVNSTTDSQTRAGIVVGDGLTKSSTLSTTRSISNDGDTDVAGTFVVTAPITAPAYIRSVSGSTTQTIKIIKDLRAATTFTTSNVSNSVNQSGVATLNITNPSGVSAHGFLVGDTVTVTSVATKYNKPNVVITAITSNSLSYVNPGPTIISISHSSNLATVTTAIAHGLIATNTFYISGTSNPIFNGVYTVVTNLSSTTFTLLKRYPTNQLAMRAPCHMK